MDDDQPTAEDVDNVVEVVSVGDTVKSGGGGEGKEEEFCNMSWTVCTCQFSFFPHPS